jgi:type II secretory pathway component PulF
MAKRLQQRLWQTTIAIGGVGLTQKAIVAKHLAVMLKSGLSITEALDVARDSAEGKLKRVLGDVLKSVESGHPLSSALAQYPEAFSGFFVNATYAGETSGTLAESLENIAEQLEKEKELAAKVRGAMVYPLIVLTAAVILGAILSFVVLPKITPLFEGLKAELPLSTRILIRFSRFMERYGFSIMVGGAGTIIVMSWLLRQSFVKPITHWLFLHTPIMKGMIQSANLARSCRTLGMLLKSGVTIDSALIITADTTRNYYYRRALNSVSHDVGRGAKLSESLNQFAELFPLLVTRMVRVGEESGRYEETLFYLANFYEVEVDASAKALSASLEPILLLAMGLGVGFLAISIITPIYDITGRLTH